MVILETLKLLSKLSTRVWGKLSATLKLLNYFMWYHLSHAYFMSN